MVRRLLRRLARRRRRQVTVDRHDAVLPPHAARRLRDLDQVTRLGEW